jgi:glycerol kinase
MKVDGGMTESDVFMQIQSDIVGIKVERPVMRESTALGAAYAAGLAVGLWDTLESLMTCPKVTDSFKPKKDEQGTDEWSNMKSCHGSLSAFFLQAIETKYACWKVAVERSFDSSNFI